MTPSAPAIATSSLGNKGKLELNGIWGKGGELAVESEAGRGKAVGGVQVPLEFEFEEVEEGVGLWWGWGGSGRELRDRKPLVKILVEFDHDWSEEKREDKELTHHHKNQNRIDYYYSIDSFHVVKLVVLQI